MPKGREPYAVDLTKIDLPLRISHGTANGYWQGCHCRPCREAHNAYKRDAYHGVPCGQRSGVGRLRRGRLFRAQQVQPPGARCDPEIDALEIDEIRSSYSPGLTSYRHLAEVHRVSVGTIRRIVVSGRE